MLKFWWRGRRFAALIRSVDRLLLRANAPSVTDIANMMREAGISPALIYAFEKTDGLMVTEMNRHLIPDKDIREFEDAYAEYMALSEAQEQRS